MIPLCPVPAALPALAAGRGGAFAGRACVQLPSAPARAAAEAQLADWPKMLDWRQARPRSLAVAGQLQVCVAYSTLPAEFGALAAQGRRRG